MKTINQDIVTEIYTERLYIRIPKNGDGQLVYNSIMASYNELKPWMPFMNEKLSVENTEENLRIAIANIILRKDIRLLIFDREKSHLIGSSGLHNIDWEVPKFEIGYWIDTRFSGNGYMLEAVTGITNYAFDNLKANRVEISCDSNNIKSKKIPEKLGYTFEACHQNYRRSLSDNSLVDKLVYARIARID